jgi:transposase InsO family protein
VEKVRYDFILAAKSQQASFIQICEAFGISTKTGYKWVNRFEEEGIEGLKDRRRNPITRPRDTPSDLQATIVATRLRHPSWGPKKIKKILERDHSEIQWPSKTTIGNILKRKGYTKKRTKHTKMAGAAPFEECTASNDVWSADFKGWWLLPDGNQCQPFTLLDTFSRLLISCRHVKSTSLAFVKPLLIEAFQEFGMPLRFRSDNGPPFATTSVGRLSRLSIWLIKLGITPEWIKPGKPQENGTHERMHRTLKQDIFLMPKTDLRTEERHLSQFQYQYNNIRPHEALSQETPFSVYRPSERKWTGELQEPVYPEDFVCRKVDKAGLIYWRGSRFFTTEMLYGESVGLKEKEGIYEVYFGPVLLGRIDPITGFKRV